MKVLLLSRYENLGASSRVRTYQYIPYLKDEGIDVTIAPLFNMSILVIRKGTKLKYCFISYLEGYSI